MDKMGRSGRSFLDKVDDSMAKKISEPWRSIETNGEFSWGKEDTKALTC